MVFVSQTGEGGELAKCSSGGNTQPEQQQPATKQNSPGGKYDSAPQSGNADAATTQRQHEASVADTMPTTGTAASGTANAPAATASNGDSTLKVAGSTAPVPAAAGAGGALEALMSAAKGQKTDAAAADRAGQQLTVAQMQEIADRWVAMAFSMFTNYYKALASVMAPSSVNFIFMLVCHVASGRCAVSGHRVCCSCS